MRKKGAADKHLHIRSVPAVLIILFSSLLASVRAQQQQQPRYSPADDITIHCGSSGNTPADDGRPWNGDVSSKFFPTDGQNVISTTSTPNSMVSVPRVPYGTARLSRSNFTYTIPVTPGPKFFRLHFFSAVYGGGFAETSKAFFTVKVGKYTLLSNFSVSLAAGASPETNGVVVKEYIVAVDGPSLAVTFSPDSKDHDGTFAFVNGIEVVSMPASLYYSPPDRTRRITYVGQEGLYTLSTDKVLETMYRINIGGGSISPDQDTGMFRRWDTEDDYMTIRGFSVLPLNDTVKLDFRDNITSYAAPIAVYNTARSMGDGARYTKAQVRSYNLTWGFSVDSGFSYLLRLHFCEIATEVTGVGQRVFYVWIDGQAAEKKMDVFSMSGGQYVPYFRDFEVLNFNAAGGGKRWANLTVAIMANPDDSMTAYVDAILNGLEIFKLNNRDGSLAGVNPDPIRTTDVLNREDKKPGKTNQTPMIAGIVAGVIILLLAVGFFVFLRRGRRIKDSASDGTARWGPISFTNTTKSNKTRGSSTLPADLCRYFSLAEIKTATNGFEEAFIIGVGGFGNVYKGYIDNGTTAVAIKRLKSESSQGANEFKTEIEMLSHLRHRHLVSLIGYCDDHGEMILVYEYMSRGTLRDHLYKTENPPLEWKRRLEVCVGAARGLHYLHAGAKHTIIHRDVKTTNILLDDKWTAKVSDFGLSKEGPTTKGHVSTVVKGSFGYLDPEYYRRQQLTEKSDVYSFGVVLCEVLCGRGPILRNAVDKKQVNLADWARSNQRNGTLEQIMDPNLAGKVAPECLKKYGEIAASCMVDNGVERPSMSDVVWGLEFALQLQQSAEDSDLVGGGALIFNGGDKDKDKVANELVDEEEVAFVGTKNDSDGTFTCSWDDTSSLVRSSGATKISSSDNNTTNDSVKVFSEIYDPKAR